MGNKISRIKEKIFGGTNTNLNVTLRVVTSSSIMRLERKVASRVSQSSKWYCFDYLQNSIMLKTDKLVGCQQPFKNHENIFGPGLPAPPAPRTAPHRTAPQLTSSREAVPVPSVKPRIWIVYQGLSGKETLEAHELENYFRPHFQTASSRLEGRDLMEAHPDNLLAVPFAESIRNFMSKMRK